LQKPKVLIKNRFHPDVLLKAKISQNLEFSLFDSWYSACAQSEGVEALIIRSGTQIQEKWLNQFPNLKLIQTATSGFDHIDLKLCAERGVAVAHCPDAPVTAVAELTFLLILSALRKQGQIFAQMKKGDWSRETLVGRQLQGRSLGIIGCGRIGSKVAKMAQGWGLPVAIFDPYLEEAPKGVELLGYEELLRTSDILSFHVPKTAKTRHMLNGSTFEMLSSEVMIINTSRGQVINEPDLIQFLRENPTAMAGLDVFESEPVPRESAVVNLENLVASPHIGASTEESLYRSSLAALQNVESYFAEGQLADKLPPQALWWQDGQK